jgi:hypothetical protein
MGVWATGSLAPGTFASNADSVGPCAMCQPIRTARQHLSQCCPKLRRGHDISYDELSLAGLVLATGLDALVLDGAPAAVFDHLRWAVSRLWPPMLRLVEQTQAAVGDAVLSHRS